MNVLLERFKNKAALAKALQVSPPAVIRAFKRNVVPATWVPKLLTQGFSRQEIAALPIATRAADIMSALQSQDEHGAEHGADNRNNHVK
ncbi:hypothetical protein [Aeromonas veronii]